MKQNFDKAFKLTVGAEGGYTADRKDKGNWTGGRIGVGELKGTKYGISAASFPDLDIKNLTLDQSKAIYRRDYWNAIMADQLPDGVDLIVFDAAVNHGVKEASRMLQFAVVPQYIDGTIGPMTIKAAASKPARDTIKEIAARRHLLWGNLSTFSTYGLGWSRRGVDSLVASLDHLNGRSEE